MRTAASEAGLRPSCIAGSLFSLASTTAELSSQGCVVWNGSPVLDVGEGDAVGTATPSPGAVQLEVLFCQDPNAWGRAAIIARGGDVLACVPLGLSTAVDAARKPISAIYQSNAALFEDETSARDIVNYAIGRTPLGRELDCYAPQVSLATDIIYSDAVFHARQDALPAGVMDALRATGRRPSCPNRGSCG